jgi:hypothetical protein
LDTEQVSNAYCRLNQFNINCRPNTVHIKGQFATMQVWWYNSTTHEHQDVYK